MNGELYQICKIVVQAKKALKTRSMIVYDKDLNVDNTVFAFAPKFMGQNPEYVNSVDEWYSRCLYNGLVDIKYVLLPTTPEMKNLGNKGPNFNCILTFFADGRIMMWKPTWGYVKPKEGDEVPEEANAKPGWTVIYTECALKEHPNGRPKFFDNSAALRSALENVIAFADKIDYAMWKEQFPRSLEMLDGNFDYAAADEVANKALAESDSEIKEILHLNVPEEMKNIYEAAANADTVCTMTMSSMDIVNKCKELGVEDELKAVLGTLIKETLTAIMYAVNEW